MRLSDLRIIFDSVADMNDDSAKWSPWELSEELKKQPQFLSLLKRLRESVTSLGAFFVGFSSISDFWFRGERSNRDCDAMRHCQLESQKNKAKVVFIEFDVDGWESIDIWQSCFCWKSLRDSIRTPDINS